MYYSFSDIQRKHRVFEGLVATKVITYVLSLIDICRKAKLMLIFLYDNTSDLCIVISEF